MINHAIAGGFGAAERTTASDRFAGDHAGGILAGQFGILIHHPAHHLWGGTHIRGGHILPRADIAPNRLNVAAAQALFFADSQGGRVNDNTALSATQRNIRHGAFPGHPGGQRAHGIHRFGRMEANTALAWADGVVVLHVEAVKNPDLAIIHAHRDTEMEFAQRPAQVFTHLLIQLKLVGYLVKLLLRHLKGVGCCCVHGSLS